MGYLTKYELTWKALKYNRRNANISSDLERYSYAIDRSGESVERCKWYDHEKDLLLLSKEYPDVLFTLTGIGEDFSISEPNDIWVKYFLNGRTYKDKILVSIPKFIEDCLCEF